MKETRLDVTTREIWLLVQANASHLAQLAMNQGPRREYLKTLSRLVELSDKLAEDAFREPPTEQ